MVTHRLPLERYSATGMDTVRSVRVMVVVVVVVRAVVVRAPSMAW